MPHKAQAPTIKRSKGWTAYQRHFGRDGNASIVIKADGEIVPMGYGDSRPATEAEIKDELAEREARNRTIARINAFRERPDWQCADDIRHAIETMEHDHHPLDRLTPEEWKALRDKICGRQE